jgi:hypothetical protein
MSSSVKDWFFLRPGFESFGLEPDRDSNLLIGERDREHRDWLLRGLEEAQLVGEGFKAVTYGDYGRGKTHQCRNLIYEIEHQKLAILPLYVKCFEFKSKEQFGTLFRNMVERIHSDDLKQTTTDYYHMVERGQAEPILDIVESEDIEQGFRALASPNDEIVRLAMKWLGGMKLAKNDRNQIGSALPEQLTVSRDFAAVAKGLCEIYRQVKGKQLAFLLDEVERFGQITHDDTYWSWVASLRALTELADLSLIFFVGAKTRDEIPNMLLWDEVSTRIGTNNFKDLHNPGREELREWIHELFQTLVRKGPVPAALQEPMGAAAADTSVPQELQDLTGGDADRLKAYPFTPSALDLFVEQCMAEALANKPREVLKQIQRSAARALTEGERVIDEDTLMSVKGDGF